MSVAGQEPPEQRAARALSLAATLETRLAPLAPSELDIRDDGAQHVGHAGAAGGAGHFSVTIVSHKFLGMTRLARHRAVLDCVGDLIPFPVHALAIHAYAPDEPRSNERMKQ
jgi:BolA family transcriptional regulator, general stress-responsive regulator